MSITTPKARKAHTQALQPHVRAKLIQDDPYAHLDQDDKRALRRCINGLPSSQRSLFSDVFDLTESRPAASRADIAANLERPGDPPRLNPHDIDLLRRLTDVGLLIESRRVASSGRGAEVCYHAPRLVRDAYESILSDARAEYQQRQERRAREQEVARLQAERQAQLNAEAERRKAELAEAEAKAKRKAEREAARALAAPATITASLVQAPAEAAPATRMRAARDEMGDAYGKARRPRRWQTWQVAALAGLALALLVMAVLIVVLLAR